MCCAGYRHHRDKDAHFRDEGRLGNLLKVTRLTTGRAELRFYFFGTIYLFIYFYKTTLTLKKKEHIHECYLEFMRAILMFYCH